MPEKVMPGPVAEDASIREAVCLHTRKIFDSCRDKDCMEDLRVYPTVTSQEVLSQAMSIKPGRAELLYTYIDVEPVGFNRGFYTVDARFFYRVTACAFTGAARPVELSGLAVFDKRVILFGSEGGAKMFSSAPCGAQDCTVACGCQLPTAVVEAVDPILLNMKVMEACSCPTCDCVPTDIPACVSAAFDSALVTSSEGRRMYVSLGQFSIIRMERDTQLLMPAYDYCMPDKECVCGDGDCGCDDPCEVFRQVKFPVDEFFPPNTSCSCSDGHHH